jgi:drug/metabolite transporter (DMT)-like permease
MPLPNITAILQAVPLVVTLMAAAFLGEAVGWKRLSAILAGFAGVLLIVKPGGEGFNTYTLLAIACVFTVAIRDLFNPQAGQLHPVHHRGLCQCCVRDDRWRHLDGV